MQKKVFKIKNEFLDSLAYSSRILYVCALISILYIPGIFLQLVGISLINSKFVAVCNLLLLICLSVKYKLYLNRRMWYAAVFVTWMIITSLWQGAGIIKAVGNAQIRMWYLAFLICEVAYLLEEEYRKKWLYILLLVCSVVGVTFLVIVLVKTTSSVLIVNNVEDWAWGVIKNGRINAFSNANILGASSSAIFMSSTLIWVLHGIGPMPNKKIVYRAISIMGILVSMVILGLAGSRGAILATGFGAGIIVAEIIRNKLNITKILPHIVIALMASAVIAVGLISIGTLTRAAYADALIGKAERMYGIESEEYFEIKEQMTPSVSLYDMDSLSSRPLIWKAAFRMISENSDMLITGITAAKAPDTAIRDVYEGRPDKVEVHAHNGYVQVIFLYGIPGGFMLMVLLAEWILSWFKVFVSKNHYSRYLLAFPIASLALGMVEIYPFPHTQFYLLTFFFFTTVGICCEKTDNLLRQEPQIEG